MRRFEIINKDDSNADIYIYDVIGEDWFGGVSAAAFQKEIVKVGARDVNVYINSPGGDVFDGITIYNLLNNHKGKVHVRVDGLAASAASIISMAGDTISMARNAMMMIHNASAVVWGGAEEHMQAAELLTKVNATLIDTYVARTGKDEGDIANMMNAETWMDADEAIENGFATGYGPELKAAACYDPKQLRARMGFSNAPDKVAKAPAFDAKPPAPEPLNAEKLAASVRERVAAIDAKI